MVELIAVFALGTTWSTSGYYSSTLVITSLACFKAFNANLSSVGICGVDCGGLLCGGVSGDMSQACYLA